MIFFIEGWGKIFENNYAHSQNINKIIAQTTSKNNNKIKQVFEFTCSAGVFLFYLILNWACLILYFKRPRVTLIVAAKKYIEQINK